MTRIANLLENSVAIRKIERAPLFSSEFLSIYNSSDRPFKGEASPKHFVFGGCFGGKALSVLRSLRRTNLGRNPQNVLHRKTWLFSTILFMSLCKTQSFFFIMFGMSNCFLAMPFYRELKKTRANGRVRNGNTGMNNWFIESKNNGQPYLAYRKFSHPSLPRKQRNTHKVHIDYDFHSSLQNRYQHFFLFIALCWENISIPKNRWVRIIFLIYFCAEKPLGIVAFLSRERHQQFRVHLLQRSLAYIAYGRCE